jgi:hypothetical protein
VQDHNDFTDWYESCVQRLLDRMQASLLNVLVQVCELVNHVFIVVVVDQKVYEDITSHSQLKLEDQVGVVHALLLNF